MQERSWVEIAAAACNHAGITPTHLEIAREWKSDRNLVCRIDGKPYLKLYTRHPLRQFDAERCALQVLAAGGIPAPRLIAAAAPAGLPPYIVTTAVSGASVEDTWNSLSRSEQLGLAHKIGAVTAAYHRLPQQPLGEVAIEEIDGKPSIIYERAQRLAELEESPTLPSERRLLYQTLPVNRDSLIHFISSESLAYVNAPAVFSHCDLSHAHVFVSNAAGKADDWAVSGVIDWAEAMLAPPEWDITFHWFWTFTRDCDAMKACLQAYFNGSQPPEHFARRCFAVYLHTYAWVELWLALRHEFTPASRSGTLVQQMIEFLFPPQVFGPAD